MTAILRIQDPLKLKAEVILGSETVYIIDGYHHVRFINGIGEKRAADRVDGINVEKLGRYLQRRGVIGYDDRVVLERR
jgi:hypothetical protein